MKKKGKMQGARLFLGIFLLFLLAGGIWWQQQPRIVRLGVYAGSSWDVPTKSHQQAEEAKASLETIWSLESYVFSSSAITFCSKVLSGHTFLNRPNSQLGPIPQVQLRQNG